MPSICPSTGQSKPPLEIFAFALFWANDGDCRAASSLDWEIVHWARPLMQLQSGGFFASSPRVDVRSARSSGSEGPGKDIRGADRDWTSDVSHTLIA